MTDSDRDDLSDDQQQVDRRQFLAATTGIAALTAGCSSIASQGTPVSGKKPTGPVPTPPFDSIRDWVAALDAHGLLIRFPEINQDQYEATGIVFRSTDMFGQYGAPGYLF